MVSLEKKKRDRQTKREIDIEKNGIVYQVWVQ